MALGQISRLPSLSASHLSMHRRVRCPWTPEQARNAEGEYLLCVHTSATFGASTP